MSNHYDDYAISANAYNEAYNFNVYGVSYAGEPRDNTAVYITKKVAKLINNLYSVKNCLVFIEDTIEVTEDIKALHCFVCSNKPANDYVNFANKLFRQIDSRNKSRKFTLTEQGYYIGENTTIGKDSYIEAGCFIGHDVVIGDRAQIFSGAKIITANIGNDFIARHNCTIGTPGFTMTEDEDGNKVRIPTLGGVKIGNNVEIGALSNISCGSAGDTWIGDYVKTDSFVHIAHDDTIGKNTEFAAGVVISGFNRIGENVFFGVNSTTRNRITIGNNCMIGMGAAIMSDVPDGAFMLGNPARQMPKKD
jgi:UDP-3-O-[3-hydroxymyristoyl] glucosamine N-acyltransferase